MQRLSNWLVLLEVEMGYIFARYIHDGKMTLDELKTNYSNWVEATSLAYLDLYGEELEVKPVKASRRKKSSSKG